MKNNKGFISVSIIYSFFIVFLLIMLSMLASYANKRYLTVKYGSVPPDLLASKCEDEKLPLSYCLIKNEHQDDTGWNKDKISKYLKPETPPSTTVKSTDNCPNAGVYQAKDNLGTSTYYAGNVKNNYVYYAGYIWRIVRINGDGSIRLIYTGDANADKAYKEGSNSYITVNDVFADYVNDECNGVNCDNWKNISVSKTRYNYFWILNEAGNVCSEIQKTFQKAVNTNTASLEDQINGFTSKFNSFLGTNWTINTNGLKELSSASVVSKDNILKCMAQIGDSENQTGSKIFEYFDNIAGGEFLWNIGYMNNHSHLLEYDSMLDNQDDSEVKMWVDTWYEKNIANKSDESYIKRDSIFCGDKSLQQAHYCDGGGLKERSTDNLVQFSYNLTAGRFTFGAFNRLGGSRGTCTNSSENNNNVSSATLICPNTGGKLAVFDGAYKYLGDNVLNLSNYSAKSAGESPYLVYEQKSKCNNDIGQNIKVCISDTSKCVTKSIFTFGKKQKISECINEIKDTCENASISSNCSLTSETTNYFYNDNTYTTLINNDWIINHSIEKPEEGTAGNKQLKYPVGLLSADEAVFAGARINKSCPTYLDQDMTDNNSAGKNTFWTMSLAYTNILFNGNNGARYYIVEKTNNGTKLSLKNDTSMGPNEVTGSYMRPIIDIKDVEWGKYCANGPTAGTKSNPYRIGETCNEE